METQAREWLKVPEVAEELGIPRSRAYELIQHGELPAVRIGERSIRVNRRELERFLLETRQVVASQTGHPYSGPKTRGERF
jgi:excisionase family DNA binding protein